jgi:hypothetical protein
VGDRACLPSSHLWAADPSSFHLEEHFRKCDLKCVSYAIVIKEEIENYGCVARNFIGGHKMVNTGQLVLPELTALLSKEEVTER